MCNNIKAHATRKKKQLKALFKTTGGSWSSISPFPIAGQLKGYTRGKLASDFRAGFNVAVLSFPVNMAYALVAGLPISYGIFSGIVAAIIGLCCAIRCT